MGRWDPKESKFNFNLDVAGIALLAVGTAITLLSVGSDITGFTFMIKGLYLISGLATQLFFIVAGVTVCTFGIILLLVNGGQIKLKPLKYGDDRFYADDDEWRY